MLSLLCTNCLKLSHHNKILWQTHSWVVGTIFQHYISVFFTCRRNYWSKRNRNCNFSRFWRPLFQLACPSPYLSQLLLPQHTVQSRADLSISYQSAAASEHLNCDLRNTAKITEHWGQLISFEAGAVVQWIKLQIAIPVFYTRGLGSSSNCSISVNLPGKAI